jgi:hypothetical protein
MYGLDLFPGAGTNEGLIGHTYEVVGSPEKPVIHINQIPVPGELRKFWEFRTGKQDNPAEFPAPNSLSNH